MGFVNAVFSTSFSGREYHSGSLRPCCFCFQIFLAFAPVVFRCGGAGIVVCCDFCHVVFHPRCLEVTPALSSLFACPDCKEARSVANLVCMADVEEERGAVVTTIGYSPDGWPTEEKFSLDFLINARGRSPCLSPDVPSNQTYRSR